MATVISTISGLLNLTLVSNSVVPIGAQIRLVNNTNCDLNNSRTSPSLGTAKTAAVIGGPIVVKTNFKEIVNTKSQSLLVAGSIVEIDEPDSNNDTMYRIHTTGNLRYGMVLKNFVPSGSEFIGEIGLFINPF